MKSLVPALLLSLFSLPAAALSITNLDSKPHRIAVQSIGGEERVETVVPNATIYLQETRVFLFALDSKNPERRIRGDNDEEYTIWGDGALQIQKYNSFSTRGTR